MGWGSLEKMPHLMRCDITCREKRGGGFGIRKIFNP